MSRNPYVTELPKTSWFMSDVRYKRYMAREVSCIFVGLYSCFMIYGLKALSEGQAAWQSFVASWSSPLMIVLHVLTLGFVLYHATTWFNVTHQAMPIQRGETFVPGSVIVIAHYAIWIVVSLLIIFLAVGA